MRGDGIKKICFDVGMMERKPQFTAISASRLIIFIESFIGQWSFLFLDLMLRGTSPECPVSSYTTYIGSGDVRGLQVWEIDEAKVFF